MSRLTGRKAATIVAAVAVTGSALLASGAQAATATDIPVVTKVGPIAVKASTAVFVSISGKNFLDSAAPSVSFGGTAGTSPIVVSDTRMLVKTPATLAQGIYHVSVTNSKGVSLDTPADNMATLAPATITGLQAADGTAYATGAAVGSAAGGDTFIVKGTGLQYASGVTVGGVAAKIVKRGKTAANEFLTVTTAAHAPVAGTASPVVVTTPAGVNTAPTVATDDDFGFAPTVKTSSLKSAFAGSVTVLTGTGFSALSATAPAKIGDQAIAAATFVVVSDTEAVAVLPAFAGTWIAGSSVAVSLSTDGTTFRASTVKIAATA